MSISAKAIMDLLPLVADRDWRIRKINGFIRDRDGRCPVCALINEIDPKVRHTISVGPALQEVGVRVPLSGIHGVDLVIYAADNRSYCNQRLRERLIDILGAKQ